jgi:hypothetical protein
VELCAAYIIRADQAPILTLETDNDLAFHPFCRRSGVLSILNTKPAYLTGKPAISGAIKLI